VNGEAMFLIELRRFLRAHPGLRRASRFERERALLWSRHGKPDGLGGLIRPGDAAWEASGGYLIDVSFYAAVAKARTVAGAEGAVTIIVRERPAGWTTFVVAEAA
jgi:hypothetical protein